MLALARQALEEQNYTAALEHAERLLEADQHSIDALEVQSEALQFLDRPDEAAVVLRTIIDLSPDEPVWKLSLANLLLTARQPEEQDFDEIDDVLESARLESEGVADVLIEVHFLRGLSAAMQGDHLTSSQLFAQVLTEDQEFLEAKIELAMSQFELGRFDEADRLVTQINQTQEDAEATHLLAMLAERRGADAQALYARAHSLDPDAFPVPFRLTRGGFEKCVADSIEQLPPQAAPHLPNVLIVAEDFPDVSSIQSGELLATTLGVFSGPTVYERTPSTAMSGEMHPRITLFQKNIERGCATREALVQEIRLTLLHEVGHYLGLSEEDLFSRGLD
jgi:predicted Zn-dependent protease with MMP-like domain